MMLKGCDDEDGCMSAASRHIPGWQFGTVCLTLLETLRRVPRRRGRGKAARTDPSDTGETRELVAQGAEGIKALGSRENWTNA
ncbi:hypothetical protein FRC12_014593 [Ceratobasidium sp. 428]|nr:hypothetical protein FRC12_014593 [Ceratobasidium sp. 428]